MTVRQLHILIEQMLQKMGAFAYDDLQKEEVDVAINFVINEMIRRVFSPKDERQVASISKSGFEDVQLTVDDLRVLLVEDFALTGLVTVNASKVRADLPLNYDTLINDRSVLTKPGCTETTSPNRLTNSETLHWILKNKLSKTVPESPVSSIAGNTLSVHTDGFTVSQVLVDYVKKPALVDYNTPPAGAGILEFPEKTCYKISKIVSRIAAIWIEEPPVKVEQLRLIESES